MSYQPSCQGCNSSRILRVCAKCSDLCDISIKNIPSCGYVPEDMGIGGGDSVDFDLCLDCGQLQGKFPIPPTEFEKDCTDEELKEFFEENFDIGKKFDGRSESCRISKSANQFGIIRLELFINKFMRHVDACKVVVPDTDKFIRMYRANSCKELCSE
jgi:hypothetical protein